MRKYKIGANYSESEHSGDPETHQAPLGEAFDLADVERHESWEGEHDRRDAGESGQGD